MAASDARWPPLKNTAWRVTFPALDADGDLVADISDMDSERSINQGAFADCSNEAVEIAAASGMYYLDLNASEMNGVCIAIIAKSEYCKTTPIVVYPVSGGFNEGVTDHDKTQSDIADLSTKVASDNLLTQSDLSDIISELVVLDAAIDSDSLVHIAEHDATQAKIESDSILFDADHDKTQSDILLVDAAIDSDALLFTTAISDVKSELVVVSDAILILDTAVDSDQLQTENAISDVKSELVLISDAVLVLDTKADSDALLVDADHDKTQSDIGDLSTKLGSDILLVEADIATVDAAIDSDALLADADHDKTQSDIALLDDGIVRFTVDTVVNGHAPTTTEFQADDITEATADHYIGRIVTWLTGALAGQSTDITDYEAVGGIGQFTVTAMTEAPANNDTGKIT